MELIISGAGALAREIFFLAQSIGHTVGGFLCDKTPIGTEIIHGLRVIERIGTSPLPTVIAIGSPLAKINLSYDYCFYTTLVSKSTIIQDPDNTFGIGTIVCDGSVLTTNIHVGKHCLLNIGIKIGHDVTIEDYCTVSPGVGIMGNCKIGRGCDIGANATIIPRVTLPPNGVVGAGTVVTKTPEIPDGKSYVIVGVPGRVIKIDGKLLQ